MNDIDMDDYNMRDSDMSDSDISESDVFLQERDVEALQKILSLKTNGMPPHYLNSMYTVQEVIDGKDLYRPYATDKVDEGATFRGMLKYRGEIMSNIREEKPMHKWDLQAIIAMFCSNIDEHRNFDKFFHSTRSRLLFYLHRRYCRSDDKLTDAYMLACMEFAKFGSHFDATQPTYHIHRFAELFQQESENFLTLSAWRYKLMQGMISNEMVKARSSRNWDRNVPSEVQATLDFLYPGGGLDALRDAADKGKKFRKRKHGKKIIDETPRSGFLAASSDEVQYNTFRIRPLAKVNSIVSALISSMPGLSSGASLQIRWTDEMNNWSKMKKVLNEIEISSVPWGNDDEEDEEDGECVSPEESKRCARATYFREAGDVGSMVRFRDCQEKDGDKDDKMEI